MKILLIGKNGQVGYELECSLKGVSEIVAPSRAQMDLSNLDQVRDIIRFVRPTLIINAAAYTAVDKAEQETGLAMRINAEAPGVIAEEARKLGAAMIHYSTDYVFDGLKTTPYVETDPVSPSNNYGLTKAAGEWAIQITGIPHLILRTSWIYGMRGNNFLLTILRLANQQSQLNIVDDQFGAPTWSHSIAIATKEILKKITNAENEDEWWSRHSGIFHMAAEGKVTWRDFGEKILLNAERLGWLSDGVPIIKGISSQEYSKLVKRPENSLLNCNFLALELGITLGNWDKSLGECFLTAIQNGKFDINRLSNQM